MNSGRMKKLAGINEEYTAFNDYFEIDRYDLPEDSIKRSYLNTPIRNGNWCKYEDVAELESVAREMLEIVQMTIATSAPNNLGGIIKAARKVLAKIPK